MFDNERTSSIFAAVSPPADVAASAAEPARVPLERLEAQICELAGHLAAATCRFLVLLGDFDARRGWASWEMNSCAQWLSWKCQMSSGTAREHVRVARALRDLPVIRARFAAGRLSYAKVRALTRIATAATEAGLAELAGPMTGNQLERFARAHRQVTAADDADARVRRRLTWRFEEDGSLAGTFRLPPLAGAVLLKALRAACADLAGQAGVPGAGVSAETPAATDPPAADAAAVRTSSDLADGLVAVAESFLAAQVAGADDAEIYQVVVHAGTSVLTEPAAPAADPAGVSAETPPATARVPGDPADPARCHVEDGPAISVSTAQMIGCTAALSWMTHGDGGAVLARPGTASASTLTTPSTSASPTPAPRSRNKPTGNRPRSLSSGRTRGSATSAPRSTTSGVTTTKTRPPDNPSLYDCFAISRLLRTETDEANEKTQLGAGCTGGGCIHRGHDRAGHAGPGGLVRQRLDHGEFGATWAQVESLTDNGWFNSISCASTQNCWAAGAGSTDALAGTSDGGSSWSTVTSDTTNELGSISCLSISTCVAVTDNGIWVTSDDGGL